MNNFLFSAAEVIIERINFLLENNSNVIVAIDGRCASGKTTLGRLITEEIDCNLVHMDDFFLRPEQRTAERLATAGENIDHERFLEEVLKPLKRGEPFEYRTFDCHTAKMGEKITVTPKNVTVIEGAYSCHSALKPYYDLKIFVSAGYETRIDRIRQRDGEEALRLFVERWIPLEEKYFSELKPQNECEMCFEF